MKKILSAAPWLLLLMGLSVLLYPAFANWWNGLHQSRAIASYTRQVAQIDPARYDEIWSAAWAYNRSLTDRHNAYLLSDGQKSDYDALLNIGGSGVMGYIEIPAIGCSLPICHGTDETVLQTAVGHLEWTSLPVGGESSHCVLSGHRGLPSAKLFTHLDRMTVGDRFILQVLDETLCYQVDQILTVLPDETEALQIQEGQDLCTLVTCTPYGVNSHRLLVRGHRVAAEPLLPEAPEEAPTAVPWLAWLAIPVAAAAAVLIWLLCRRRRRGGDGSAIP